MLFYRTNFGIIFFPSFDFLTVANLAQAEMAPQNSTLLHENVELCAESHYSPILKSTFNDMLDTCSSSADTDEIVHLPKSISKFDRVNYEQVRKCN